jgi:hypothetical protein
MTAGGLDRRRPIGLPAAEPVYIVAPGEGQTGGVELLHQLADALWKINVPAYMVYYPFSRRFETPSAYKAYDSPDVDVADIIPGARVVLPETYTYLIDRFSNNAVDVWWMSVDNYLGSAKVKYWLGNRFAPWTYYDMGKRRFPAHVEKHLVQSDYARSVLRAGGVFNTGNLGDYINPDYALPPDHTPRDHRDDVVLFNPAKGREQTRRILHALGPGARRAIVGMSRAEVRRAMSTAKVYIDFGNHPGKDRIPREAAAMGCCVVTNRRGSAGNDIDVPIDAVYKIDDRAEGFEHEATRIIRAIFADFEAHGARFEAYRAAIRQEPAAFEAAVREHFA